MHASHVAATHRKGKRGSSSPKTPAAESGKSRPSKGKTQGVLGWIPVAARAGASCWVLGQRGECGDIRSHDTAIVSGSLFGRAIPATSLDVGDHLPRRHDSMFMHPDTMHLCGFVIAQPVAVRNVNSPSSGMAICKPWPLKKLQLDAVGLSQVVLQSCRDRGAEGGGKEGREGWERVEVWRVTSPSLLPLASEVHLTTQSAVDSSILNDSFKNYTRALYDGSYLCEGNTVSVLFCNEVIEFIVEKLIPVGQRLEPNMGSRLSVDTSRTLTARLEDSLLLDISGLCLGEGGRERSCSPARLSSHCQVVTSTPGMDVDEGPAQSGTESGGPQLEPNHATRKRDTPSLEDQMQELDLADSEGDKVGGTPVRGQNLLLCEGEEGLVEVMACKITAKTKIVFLEKRLEKGRRVVSMRDVGGLVPQKQLLQELVLYPLKYSSAKGVQFPHGVLLHGPPGVGKSLLASAVCSETTAYTVSRSASDFTSPEVLVRLQMVFKEAREKSPSLVLLEDLHCLGASGEGSAGGVGHQAFSILAACLDALHTAPPPRHVVVIATTNHIEAVDSSLRRPGRFDREIEVTTPSAVERKQVLGVLLSDVAHGMRPQELVGVADSAHGYTGADLRAVCMHAQHRALRRQLSHVECGGGEGGGNGEGPVVRVEDMKCALREVRPSAMREVTVEVPKVLWTDIGGQADVKRRLKEAVEWPLQHPEAFSRLGITPPKGVLLFGPPGCSKTMIARALATESGLNFIAVKGPELFSKWVGDSERAVRQVFQRARAVAPAIIFFDEIDALAVQRKSEGSSSSVADRVLAQLLTEMDGVEMLRDVLIVAATNRPDMIDKALLRPGRIDRLIYVPLPSDHTRKEIFQINFRRTPVDSDVSLDQLVASTQGFSGAEVVALCQEAGLCAMHEDISVERVSLRHFQQALQTITPQTQPAIIASYERYCKTLQ